MPSIEDIILQKDGRNMTGLRPHLPERYTTDAANLILEHPGKAIIATGFYILSAGAPETDGPPGAVAIGNALARLGYEVRYLADRFSSDVLRAIAHPEHPVIEFPVTSHRESADFAHTLFQSENPSILISIERCGLTREGTYRNFRGADISEFNAKIDHLFEQYPYSVGIGDGGNEIGMGNLKDVMPGLDKLPDDPCITTTRALIAASVSNWGGYGLVTALSLLRGENLLPSVDEESEWLERIVAAGAVEGMTGEAKPWVDNFPPEENSACLRQLHGLLEHEGLQAGA